MSAQQFSSPFWRWANAVMKRKIWIGVIWLSCAGLLPAAETVRLALVAEDSSSLEPLDLLTAAFSTNSQLALLERAQIDKVLREQALSLANGQDFLKLGQLLGADGLLLLESVKDGTNRFLASRLVAVNPGVVIDAARVSWPAKDLMPWAGWLARRLDPLYPKLRVLRKDAIPISIVNLRSAVRSREAEELERQLTLLTIERLSRERELFVLERRQMQRLSAEKELKAMEESAFWNGSYLLEGIVDRDGFSTDTLTISARLVPPNGGARFLIEVSGSRTNLSEAINRLAARVREGLKLGAGSASWNPQDEADQFFREATWALKWQMTREAQAASESAWALGKRDLDCALARVKSYIVEMAPDIDRLYPDMPPAIGQYLRGTHWDQTQRDPGFEKAMREIRKEYPEAAGVFFEPRGDRLDYVVVGKAPEPGEIDQADHVLRLYDEFSRTLPAGEPKADSPWHRLGAEALISAAQVLQHFYLVPESRKSAAGKLKEVRALAREVAGWISKSPSVRASYSVGERVATHDELAYSVAKGPNIFLCKVECGCFWQERPEDCIALYRDLMTSPVFAYLHTHFWFRAPESPRLTAWSEEDKKRAPTAWRNFVQELNTSTNFLLRMEAKAIELADAEGENQLETAFNGLFTSIFDNREAIVTNNVELLYLNWSVGELIQLMGHGVATSLNEKLGRQFYRDYQPRLEALNREYWGKTVPLGEGLVRFERQKEYLTNNTPFDLAKFSQLFRFDQSTKAQAAELVPLLSTYKSNLSAQLDGKMGRESARIQGGSNYISFVETQFKRLLNPPPPTTNTVISGSSVAPPASHPTPPSKTPQPLPDAAGTNVLLVKRFLKIPVERLAAQRISGLTVFAHRWREDKLWLDLRYSDQDSNGLSLGFRAAAASWDPRSDRWEVIQYPGHDRSQDRVPVGFMGETGKGLYFELFAGSFYLSEWETIKKYDFQTRRWQVLNFPGQKLAQLSAIGGHLFAANDESIFEILDEGRSTRILASCRRRPAVSALDSLESLGSPTLFPGPNHSVAAIIGQKVYSWSGHDWAEVLDMGFRVKTVPLAQAVILWSDYQSHTRLWLLPHDQSRAELCLDEALLTPWTRPVGPGAQVTSPTWRGTEQLSLTRAAVDVSGTNLYFFLANSREATNSADQWTVEERNGRHANLVLLDHEFAKPFVVPFKFNLAQSPFTDQGPNSPSGRFIGFGPLWWITLTPDSLVIGKANVPGFWVMPRSEVDELIGQERRRRSEEKLRQIATVDSGKEALLAKYDVNHNGAFDPAEKAKAIDDPAFLELELKTIDADQNGRLEAGELNYFDSNNNGILDSKEQAGIAVVQRLLANKMVEEFDTDKDRLLDRVEFAALSGNTPNVGFSTRNDLIQFDTNHDGKLDLDELTSFLMLQTRRSLIAPGSPRALPERGGMRGAAGREASFWLKSDVEAYWKRHGPSGNAPADPVKSPGTAAAPLPAP